MICIQVGGHCCSLSVFSLLLSFCSISSTWSGTEKEKSFRNNSEQQNNDHAQWHEKSHGIFKSPAFSIGPYLNLTGQRTCFSIYRMTERLAVSSQLTGIPILAMAYVSMLEWWGIACLKKCGAQAVHDCSTM